MLLKVPSCLNLALEIRMCSFYRAKTTLGWETALRFDSGCCFIGSNINIALGKTHKVKVRYSLTSLALIMIMTSAKLAHFLIEENLSLLVENQLA